MIHFDPASIYGNRSGFHEILLVTGSDKQNVFMKSAFWRTGVVTGVTMLGRAEMAKVPKDLSKYFGGETRFTRVQEMKQD